MGVLKNFAKFPPKNACVGVSFNEVAVFSQQLYDKGMVLVYLYFPINFAKFVRAPFVLEHFQTNASISLIYGDVLGPSQFD